ncbi:MAG TPA: hypothetical protein PKD26_06505 [Pyrinomonadaceae bacterium]|nr:hypothetical protein [Pyrinomonadaceae bacterium]
MRRPVITVLFAAFAGVLAACQPTETPKPNAPASTPSPAVSPAVPGGSPAAADPKMPSDPARGIAALEGEWPGKDETSMTITKTGDKYKVVVTGKDKKSASFEGTAKGETIEFRRNGKLETIMAATPDETGLKWTQGEKSCVVVTKGSEGYCRK